ncbi:MAG: hypothetical protein WBZ27_21195 [Pseudolabrys sp.]|jgi:hypothetical protein
MHQAVGTSAGVGVPITIAGTIGYMLAGWRHMPLRHILDPGRAAICC